MNIQKYTSWFHDGALGEILHEPNRGHITIVMNSSQIVDWDEFDKKIELSKNQTI